jgi:hypothetical protein
MEQLWSMYNKVEKLRIDGLKTDHVRIILLSVPTRHMGQWYACREGDMEWRPLDEITEFYEDVRVYKGATANTRTKESPTTRGQKAAKPSAPPLKRAPEERRPLFEEPPEGLLTDPGIAMVTSKVKERRSTRRFARQLEFRVKSADKNFKCETHDISTHGLSLREPLPRWVPKTFRATLSHAGANVRVLCTRVSDTKLQLVDAESWDMIRQWIVKW